MTIAILECGPPPRRLIAEYGRYPDMFADLLGSSAVGQTYDVTAGEFPERIGIHDAYLVTGSSAGVYDPLPWIDPLKAFLSAAAGKAKLVGICFGHQIMAEAFGGKVVKSDKGWGIGLQDYAIADGLAWTNGSRSVAVPVCHQDQVVEVPPQAVVIGGNDFCPIGGLAWRDQSAISFQFHPEFEPGFVRELIAMIDDELPDSAAAAATLDRPNDRCRVGAWINTFAGEAAA
jgi:GMP synthase-like glutamine amidotransferase